MYREHMFPFYKNLQITEWQLLALLWFLPPPLVFNEFLEKNSKIDKNHGSYKK